MLIDDGARVRRAGHGINAVATLALTGSLAVGACGGASSEQRDALRVGSAVLGGCPSEEVRISGRNHRYTVEGCMRRVAVQCRWSGGLSECVTAGEVAAERAEARRARETQGADPREAERRPAERQGSPRVHAPLGSGVAFRREAGVGDDVTLELEVRDATIAIVARTSRRHRAHVLVTATVERSASVRCGHELQVGAAGELTGFAAEQVDGATSHHVIEAEVFDSLADRPPIQIGMCGRVVHFETRELRALRAFVEAHSELLGEP